MVKPRARRVFSVMAKMTVQQQHTEAITITPTSQLDRPDEHVSCVSQSQVTRRERVSRDAWDLEGARVRSCA